MWIGSLPDMGVERHYRGLDKETVSALHTILDLGGGRIQVESSAPNGYQNGCAEQLYRTVV